MLPPERETAETLPIQGETPRQGAGSAPKGAAREAAAPQGTEKTGPAEAVRQRAESAGEQSTRRTAPRQTGGGPTGAETEGGGAPSAHRTGPGGLLRTAREIRTLGPAAGMPGEPGRSGSGEGWTAEAGGALSLAFLHQEGA